MAAPALASEVPARRGLIGHLVGSYGGYGRSAWTDARPGEPANQLAIALVVEQLERRLGLQPAQLVHLVVGGELAAHGSHQPPAHQLVAPLAIAISRRG